jgi:subtilisin family serine protease
LKALIGAGPWTDDQLIRARTAFIGTATIRSNKYNDSGKSGDLQKFIFKDAVIVQAAGNDKIKADQDPSSWYLSRRDSGIQPRLLIVGSVSSNGSTSKPTSISNYSNTAGNDSDVQERFLVAYDSTPFSSGNVAFNGTTLNSGVGTSYAAPRVAGYVAIVRSKFPNLSAKNTASILLDTARYDTLTCYKSAAGCDPAIYGKGEASLSRALAPVGKLK